MSLQDRRDGVQMDCDICGEQSPFFEQWEDEVEWAKEHGWYYDAKTKENYCAGCQGEGT